MKVTDKLFKETLIRVGPENMRGIERLLQEGHTGIAERHTVQKLILYVRGLEKELGRDVPDPDKAGVRDGLIKVKQAGGVYYTSTA